MVCCPPSPRVWAQWEERLHSNVCPAWVRALRVIASLLNEKVGAWRKNGWDFMVIKQKTRAHGLLGRQEGFLCLFFQLLHFSLLKSFYIQMDLLILYFTAGEIWNVSILSLMSTRLQNRAFGISEAPAPQCNYNSWLFSFLSAIDFERAEWF